MVVDETVYDVLVIGTGAAGMTVALNLPSDLTVGLMAKGEWDDGSTSMAQGGIAAVLDATDSIESHVADTLDAGAGLCDEDAVRYIAQHGPEAIDQLLDFGIELTPHESAKADAYPLHLNREGGHSHRRIVHAADATGRAVATTLNERVMERDNIQVMQHLIAVDLVTTKRSDGRADRAVGVYAFDRQTSHVRAFRAKAVVLATGGASKAYLYTSNSDGATGDGIAMAWRAGCRVANMEFTQFHPTCLYHPFAKASLITEAVRGEGGKLLLPNGERFMDNFDSRGELAPRDIVARAIDHEMKRLGVDFLHLDISHKGEAFVKEHFPNISATCLQYGYDMAKGPIPIVPAAHYTCGGIVTDLRGRTDIPGLYAVGESAHTGLHGANRLASNSLLECLVIGKSAAETIAVEIERVSVPPSVAPWDESWVIDSDEEVVVSHNWDELRHFMWDYVGIVRTTKRLQRARSRVQLLLQEIDEYYGNFRINSDLVELRHLCVVASLIIKSALSRKESRGLHYTLDYPAPDKGQEGRDTVLVPENYPGR